MSLESLLLNALRCHLVFAGSLWLTEGGGGTVGSGVQSAEESVLEQALAATVPPLLREDVIV